MPHRLLAEQSPARHRASWLRSGFCRVGYGRLLPLASIILAAAFLQPPSSRSQTTQTSKASKAREAAAGASTAAAGKIVFDQHCAICHYGTSTAQKLGPGLKGLYSRPKFAGGGKVDDAGVSRWIQNGGKNMPGFADELKPVEMRALIAYLKTL